MVATWMFLEMVFLIYLWNVEWCIDQYLGQSFYLVYFYAMATVSSHQKIHFSTLGSNVIHRTLDPVTILTTACHMTLKSGEWIRSSTLHRSTSKTAATYFILYIFMKIWQLQVVAQADIHADKADDISM